MVRPTVYSIEQVATLCGVSTQTVRNDIKAGIIDPQILNPESQRRIYVFTDEDLRAYQHWRYETYNIDYPGRTDAPA